MGVLKTLSYKAVATKRAKRLPSNLFRLTSLRFSPKLAGIFLVTVAGISYGFQTVLSKLAYSNGANVQTVLTLRFGVASFLIGGLVLARHRNKRSPKLKARELGGFALLGWLFVSNSLFYYLSLQLLPAGPTSLLVFTYPALVVVGSVLFFGEHLSQARVLALLVALTGTILTVDPLALGGTGTSLSLLGIILAILSAFSNAIYSIVAGKIGKSTPGLVKAALSLPVTAGCFGLYTFVTGSFSSGMNLLALILCLVIGGLAGLSVGLILEGIARIGASQATIVASLEPVTVVVLGSLLLAEELSFTKVTGGLMVSAGIVLLAFTGKGKPREVVRCSGFVRLLNFKRLKHHQNRKTKSNR
jgi:drug/metabolite transporter (DMT)-like permease